MSKKKDKKPIQEDEDVNKEPQKLIEKKFSKKDADNVEWTKEQIESAKTNMPVRSDKKDDPAEKSGGGAERNA